MTLKDEIAKLISDWAGDDWENPSIQTSYKVIAADSLALIKKRLPEKRPDVSNDILSLEQNWINGFNACLEQFKKELGA